MAQQERGTMACVLLAVGNRLLRDVCVQLIRGAGHTVVLLDRPFELFTLAKVLQWDVCCVDESPLGAEALSVLTTLEIPTRIVQIGEEEPPVGTLVRVPLSEPDLLAALADAPPPVQAPAASESCFSLDRELRVVSAAGREVWLTATESRLLATLLEHRPEIVSLPALLREVWGFEDADADPDLVRTHVRNLRRKLAGVGLADALQSHRGRGYRLVV
jgi:DNA-binding winged helix-turn-helix (wHTH) protein